LINKNQYTYTGSGLLIAGILISVSAYFIFHLIWLTAFGICLLILSVIILALGRTIPRLPPEACEMLMETGINNISSLIEELGISTRAIYLPSSLAAGQPRALIPLHNDSTIPSITRTLPRRLIARYGDGPEDIGLLFSTIGGTAVTLLEYRPGASPGELESAIISLFHGKLGLAEGARVIKHDNTIEVVIQKPQLGDGAAWSHSCLGSPLASIVASITAEAWDKPVIIRQEKLIEGKCELEIEVVG
jgi:hypothetical protein